MSAASSAEEGGEAVAVVLQRDEYSLLLSVLERQYRQTQAPEIRRLYQRARCARIVPAKWTSGTRQSGPEPASLPSSPCTSTADGSALSTKAETSPTPSDGSTTLDTGSAEASRPMASGSIPAVLSGQAAFDFFEGIA